MLTPELVRSLKFILDIKRTTTDVQEGSFLVFFFFDDIRERQVFVAVILVEEHQTNLDYLVHPGIKKNLQLVHTGIRSISAWFILG